MTIQTLHTELSALLYLEDKGLVDIILASIIANSLKIGDPVWLTVIGPSSGGKSQIIRPLTKANPTLIHRLDDLTPNTFISGSLGMEHSFLGRIGPHGIISMDDLTVLFSKNAEARGEILSQFRMIYDGRFSKSSGNRKEEMMWSGYMGMIAGSTPSIYRYFAEVADMGERFVSYRMRDIDKHKAVQFVMANQNSSKELDEKITAVYDEFLKTLIQDPDIRSHLPLSAEVLQRIATIAEHCTLLRTPVHIDERSGLVDEFPEPEMPFRVMKQLAYLAQGLQCVNRAPLTEDNLLTLEWVAFSLANDKRRAYLRAVANLHKTGSLITARNVSAITGLHQDICKKGLSHLQALKIISLQSEEQGVYKWHVTNRNVTDISLRLDPMNKEVTDFDIE